MKEETVVVFESVQDLSEQMKTKKFDGCTLVMDDEHCYLTGLPNVIIDEKFEGDRSKSAVIIAAFKLLGIPVHIT